MKPKANSQIWRRWRASDTCWNEVEHIVRQVSQARRSLRSSRPTTWVCKRRLLRHRGSAHGGHHGGLHRGASRMEPQGNRHWRSIPSAPRPSLARIDLQQSWMGSPWVRRIRAGLDMFNKALAARLQEGDAEPISIARWCVARCPRSLGRLTEALDIQKGLLAAHTKPVRATVMSARNWANCIWHRARHRRRPDISPKPIVCCRRTRGWWTTRPSV